MGLLSLFRGDSVPPDPPGLQRFVGYSRALAASTFFWNTSSASALSEVKFQVLPVFCFTRRFFAR